MGLNGLMGAGGYLTSPLSYSQYQLYKRYRGGYTDARMKSVMAEPAFQKMSPGEKAGALAQAKREAEEELLGFVRDGLTKSGTRDIMEALKPQAMRGGNPCMPDILNSILKNKKIQFEKLTAYGFEKTDTGYSYREILNGEGFLLKVTVSAEGDVKTVVIDPDTNEPYTLHLADGARGSFVGNLKWRYEETLRDIAEKCFEPDVFQTKAAKRLNSYVSEEYGDELEFLWEKFPKNAVWRRKDNGKWYAALLSVTKRKLGAASDEAIEIIDLRADPEVLERLIDNQRYYPGYHMNKKHWYTLILDGSVSFEELCQRLRESYLIAGKR